MKNCEIVNRIACHFVIARCRRRLCFPGCSRGKPLQMVKEPQAKGIIQGVSADKFAPAKQ